MDLINEMRDKMAAYSKSGDQFFQQGGIDQAEQYYIAQYQTAQKLLRENNSIETLRDYACSCGRMAVVSRALGKLDAADQFSAEETEIAEQLYNQSKTADIQRMLGVSYEHRGCILSDLENPEQDLEAEKYLISCLAIRRQLCEMYASVTAFGDLIVICDILGHLFLKKGRLQDAEALGIEMYDAAEQIRDESKINNALNLQYNVALAWHQKGIQHNQSGYAEQALAEFEQARKIGKHFRTLGRTVRLPDGSEDDLQWFAAQLQLQTANSHVILEDWEKAAQAAFRGANKLEQIWQESGNQELRPDVAGANEFLGRIYFAWKNYVNAAHYFRKGLNIRWGIYEETNDAGQLPALGDDCLRIGEIHLIQKKNEEAGGHFQKAVRFFDTHYEKTKDINDVQAVCLCYQNLGHVCWNLQDWDGAKINYERTLDTIIELQKEKNIQFDFPASELGDITQRLAKIAAIKKNHDDALVYCQLCHVQRKRAMEEEPTAKNLNALALACYDLGRIKRDRGLLTESYHYWGQLCQKFPEEDLYVQRRAVAEEALGRI